MSFKDDYSIKAETGKEIINTDTFAVCELLENLCIELSKARFQK